MKSDEIGWNLNEIDNILRKFDEIVIKFNLHNVTFMQLLYANLSDIIYILFDSYYLYEIILELIGNLNEIRWNSDEFGWNLNEVDDILRKFHEISFA